MDESWDFSSEELDSLEQAAKRQIAERSSSSYAASHSASPSSKARSLPPPFRSSPSKGGLARSIPLKLFRDRPGRIALETQYNPTLVATLKTIPGHEWDQARRIWTYPEDKLESLWVAIGSLSNVGVNVEVMPPLCAPKPHSGYYGSLQSSPMKLETRIPHVSQNSPSSISPSAKQPTTIVVQLFLINPELIAARNPYHESIKEACQSVTGRAWNTGERVWTFPKANIRELVEALRRIRNPHLVLEAIPPLTLPEDLEKNVMKSPQIERQIPRVSLWPPAGKESNANVTSAPQDVNSNAVKVLVKLTLHSNGKVAAKFDYESRVVAALKSIPGAEWHAKERVWLFPPSSLQEAETRLGNIDGLSVKLDNLEPIVRRAIEMSANQLDLREKYSKIPVDLEKRLLPFQRDGVMFALQHGGRSLIADEMGLGKTLQAIAFTACFPDEWPVLVISPSSLRLHWAAMIKQWLDVPPSEILVVMPQCCGSNHEGFNIVQISGSKSVMLDALFNVVSYDLVTKLQEDIIQANFKIIIADEAHYMKNAQTKRTMACVPLVQKAKYALLLTGTPALSRPVELYKQLEALQPTVYKNVHEYGKRYCVGGHFGVYQGASNCEELHALLKTTVMIRRLKKDVLSELPQKRRQQIFLSLDDKGLKQMRTLFYEVRRDIESLVSRKLEAVKREIKCCQSKEDADKLKYSERQIISKIYTESAEVKLPAVEDYLSTIIEADCKFLIFAHHKFLLDGIEKFLAKKKVRCIRIDGSTNALSRQHLVNSFQETENIKAAVLGIQAAGVGLNLTAASMVIFAEMSWTPGDLVQAEDRAHRIGQVSSVNIYYLHAHDTVDDLIWDSVQHKLENVSQILDGKEDTLQIARTERYQSLPSGQSTLKAFLQPCTESSLFPDKADGLDISQKKRKHEYDSVPIDRV